MEITRCKFCPERYGTKEQLLEHLHARLKAPSDACNVNYWHSSQLLHPGLRKEILDFISLVERSQ